MSTKYIPLTRGRRAIVDASDCDWLCQHSWTYATNGYAIRHAVDRGMVYMHREILKPQDGFVTDHINRDKLDNRRENLRECTHQQNAYNKRLPSSSPFTGVARNGKLFRVTISARGESFDAGYYTSAKDAARAYDEKAIELHGEFALPNFDDAHEFDYETWRVGARARLDAHLREKQKKNRSPRRKTWGAIGFKGVSAQDNGYVAKISNNGNREYLGYFGDAAEAAMAVDQRSYELWGEDAYLNFPDKVKSVEKAVTNT